MPLYGFKCKECDIETEELMSLSDYERNKNLTKCEECGNIMNSLVSPLNFRLNGGDWYQDGYSSQGRRDIETESKIYDENKRKEEKLLKSEGFA